MPSPEDDDLYRPHEVAAMFGVTTTTIARWARIGRLTPSVRTPGGHRRFRRSDLPGLELDLTRTAPARDGEHLA